MNPLITIGLPFHNAEDTLLAAIGSIFAQSFQDWELILMDDGSSDGSARIARSIDDSRVRVITCQQNRGLAAVLNEIADAASGQYLARMDADDLMHPSRLERQLRILERGPEVDIVATAAYIIDGRDQPIGIRAQSPLPMTIGSLLRNNLVLHPTVTGRT